ncbi:MAG TPA: response regulator [Bryobacteraceae bacterium]|jgi:CheY-like chemotaxis protein/anti-sigma regulatory factor (Ser/Thr protein kinase)
MSGARILVADDDPDIHDLLKSILQDTVAAVDCVSSGREALARVEAQAYDLVLTDVCMPEVDGLELLQRIHERRPGLPVVVMTALNTQESVIAAIQKNAFAYFSKPFSPAAVLDMVHRALDGGCALADIEVLSAQPHWLSLRLGCRLETADRLVQFLKELQVDLPPDEQNDIAVAFRELLVNAIEHGGRFDPEKKVEVSYIRISQAILYYVRDPGEGFSFENLAHAAVGGGASGNPMSHVEVRMQAGMRPGGFGILMSRNIADELIYNEKGNQVLLVKYLPKPDQS